ncbi:MAG TPA: M48 family metalloprotease [Geminicoccaceae bacterium]|nr:M48 family metalloprotease [Geminicoccaceae bacterium]
MTMMRLKRGVLGAALLAAALTLGGCTTNPATGGRDFTPFMSPAQERQVGRQQHPQVVAQFGGAQEDPELQAYVERIGRGLAAASELPDLDFTFTVLDTDTVNAFAIPGGYVYVTRGLVALANDEAELAGVIGHEIGHVTARHSAQRQTQSVFAQLGQFGLTVLGAVFGGETGAQLGSQVGGLGGLAYVQSYSREQEFEADRLGVRYLTGAGYDPAAMASFLRTLDRDTALRQRLAGGGAAQARDASLFASHPRTMDRVERAIAEVEGATPGEGRRGRDELLARVDGMLYGEDPGQGLVRDGAFVHPDLRFAFDIPRGFRVQNTPRAVLAQGPRGDIMVFDGATAPPGRSVRDYLVRDWAGRASLRDVQTLRVDGMDAAAAATVVQAGGRRAEALLVAIRHGGERIYRFAFASPDGISRDDLRTYNAAVASFRRLSAEQAGAIRPRRLQVVTVRPGETARDLAGRMAVDRRLAEEQFRVLNGLGPDEEVQPGQRVKLVVVG